MTAAVSILVLGGAGYIGAQTCKALDRAGFRPVCLDNLCLGHRDFVRWGPLVVADIADENAIVEACRTHNVVAAIHFAAFASVAESVVDPAKYYQNNVAGTVALLSGLLRADVKKLVFSSSCAVYGEPPEQPIRESTLPAPVNPYGMSKLMVERILADYRPAYGMQSVILRYFNACGADLEGQLGELRNNETRLIPRAMMWLQGHLDTFEVFGSDYPTPDGTAIRDYIHVCDLAGAHVLALQHVLGGGKGGVFNLGTGRGHSVKQVLTEIAKVTARPLPAAIAGRRPGDPPMLIADPHRIIQQFGFRPKHSDLETIVQSAWQWHQKSHPCRRA
jgi:UDP-glucose-4-epimerase GalE